MAVRRVTWAPGLALACCIVGVLGTGVGAASAHAEVRDTTPASGERLAASPATVTLRFSEPVSAGLGAVAVVDEQGRRVDADRPTHPGDDLTAVSVALPPGLQAGSYGVLWRVVSADGHPVAGSFSFGVGAPARPPPAQPAPAPSSTLVHAVASIAAYLGAVLLVGVPFFLLAVWPAGLADPRARRLVRAGWWLAAGSALALFVVQGPFGAGLGVLSAADPGLLGQTLTGRVGLLMLGRLFVLGLAAASGPWPGTASPPGLRRDGAGLGVLLLLTYALEGHPGEGSLAPLAVLADAGHLAAVAVWLGGLAVLLGTTLRRGQPGLDLLTARWSRVAMLAVGVVVVTGTFQAWREVRTLEALRDSGYGHLLLAKLAGVAVLLVLADQSRRLVARRLVAGRPAGATAAGATVARLRGQVLAELAVAAAVLVVTSVLAGTPPPTPPASPSQPGPSLPGPAPSAPGLISLGG